MLKKLLDLLRRLFRKSKKQNSVPVIVNAPAEPVQTKPAEPAKEEPKIRTEPVATFPNGEVQTFLWKPSGDHTDRPVIVVAADSFRSQDLFCEIVGKSGRALSVNIRNAGRANHLQPYRYARIHFRIEDRSASGFTRSAPIKVRFYTKVDGTRVDVKVRGRKAIEVRDPTARVDLR